MSLPGLGRLRLAASAFAAVLAFYGALTPSAASARCTDVIWIGVRGSGETGAAYLGMGETVFRMYSRFARALHRDGQVVGHRAVSYPARGTSFLFPRPAVLALSPSVGTALWYRDTRRYFDSIAAGAEKVQEYVVSAAADCPDSSVVLAGYSQGAMAIHQGQLSLADDGNDDALDAIDGTLLVGDGDRVPRTRAHRFGSASRAGEGVRIYFRGVRKRDVFDPESTADICDKSDIVCDFNPSRIRHAPSSIDVHTGYKSRKGAIDAAVDWLADDLTS